MSGVFQSIQDLKSVFGFKKLLHKLPTFRDATTSDVWETSTEIPYWWRVIPLSSAEAPAGYSYKNSNNRKKKYRKPTTQRDSAEEKGAIPRSLYSSSFD